MTNYAYNCLHFSLFFSSMYLRTSCSASIANITSDTLQQNEFLSVGNELISINGRWALRYQSDGNLAAYSLYPEYPPPAQAFWSTDRFSDRPGKALMQSDGNLVCLDADGTIYWSSSSSEGSPPYRLTLQYDRNLVIYDNETRTIWASNTYIAPLGCNSELISQVTISTFRTCRQDSDCSYANCTCEGPYGFCCAKAGGYCPLPPICNHGYFPESGGSTNCSACSPGTFSLQGMRGSTLGRRYSFPHFLASVSCSLLTVMYFTKSRSPNRTIAMFTGVTSVTPSQGPGGHRPARL